MTTRRNRAVFGATLLAVTMTAASACASTGARLYVRAGPPVAVVDVRSVAPGPGFVWVPGFHRWNGAAYVWVPGTWQRPLRAGAAWVSGHWQHNRRGWYYVKGHWR